ncbi:MULTISPECIES: hypothetical protein [Streptomyces]|uniref:Uncharacterized protein n=1 Tax=Streptomyces fimbriatus TaxID=68197 RepID=A0ABW0DAC1_STRFI
MSRAAGFSLTTAAPVPAAGTPVTHLRGSLPGHAGSHGPVPGSLVDDVQGAPPEDREALAAHADVLREAPLMVVCAVTEDCGPEVAGFLARLARSGARLIEVGPMDVADVEELLRAPEDAADTGLMTWQRADGPSPPAAYAFSCELVRGTLLADMPPSRAHAARTTVARVKSGRRSRGPTRPPCRLPPHHPAGLTTGKVPYVPERHFFTRSPARRFTGGGI